MTQTDKAMPRIPLAVVTCSSGVPQGGGTIAGKYQPVRAAADERFILYFFDIDGCAIDGVAGGQAGVRQAFVRHPELCGMLLAAAPSDRQRPGDDIDTAAALDTDAALPPLEHAERLHDEAVGESFAARVFTCHAWRELQRGGFSLARLQAFYAQRKYLLMSRHIGTYQQVGQLLAQSPGSNAADTVTVDALASQTIALIMAALRRPPTRGGHINALSHIRGYLKNHLSGGEKIALDEALEWYRLALVPLSTPLALLRDYFARYPHAYIEQQVYMQPYLYTRFDAAALIDAGQHADVQALANRR